MTAGRLIKVVLVLAALAALVFVVTTTLELTEAALNLVERLRNETLPIQVIFGLVVVIALGLTAWLVWLLLRPSAAPKTTPPAVLDESALAERIDKAEAEGVDVSAARGELERRDVSAASLDVAVFGEISAGKSSLIAALLPGANIAASPLGGTTTHVDVYRWTSPAGTPVRLLDLPGLALVGGDDQPLLDEARRAHVVLFVCDADFTRADVLTVERLVAAGKPMIVALNKADQYEAEEVRKILARIHERVLGLETDMPVTVIPAIAGGRDNVVERDADGNERAAQRERQPDIDQLVAALNHLVSTNAPELIVRRDQALFQLAGDKLKAAEADYRRHRGEEIVRSHTRKAVIGALAAVSPGTDVVIQGYLGSSLVRELCKLHGVAVSDIAIDEFLDLSQSRVGRALPLTLAIAGNGLKAFPGIGTVTGGAVHAIAYGLIFDALGRGLLVSLAERDAFETGKAADRFSAELNMRLEQRVARIARIAIAELGDGKQ